MEIVILYVSIIALAILAAFVDSFSSNFIELEDTKGFKFTINKKNIVAIRPDTEDTTSISFAKFNTTVKGSYDQVKRRIK